MLSKIPINLDRIKKEDLDKEILRSAIIAELDAINLYEQMADMTQDTNVKKLLLDVAREEKTHVGEFQTLLLSEDPQQKSELKEGEKEVEALLKEKNRPLTSPTKRRKIS
jgi:rubrerythrin